MKRLLALLCMLLVGNTQAALAQLPVAPNQYEPQPGYTMKVTNAQTPAYVPSWIGAHAITASTTLLDSAETLQTISAAGGVVNVVLPPAINTKTQASGHPLCFKAIDISNAITLTAAAGDTIDGAASVSMTTLNQCTILESDGTHTWRLITTGTGGGGGTPGGTNGQLQYNNAGAFGGVPAVNGDGTLNTTTGNLAVTKTGGVSFAPSATTDTTNATNITSGTIPAARLPLFGTSAIGAVPASGGGTTNFLRADGTFANPGGGLSAISNNQVLGNTSGSSAVPTGQNIQSSMFGSNVLDIAHGGTNNGSLPVIQGSVVYTDGTKQTSLAPGAIGQFLQSGGTGANPSYKTNLYNTQGSPQDPTLQPNLQAGIQAVRDGVDDCVVCLAGDSTMAGYGATGNQTSPLGNQYLLGTPATRLRQQLATKYQVPVAEGFSGPNYNGFTGGGLGDSRWANSTAWPTSGFGFFSSGAMQGDPALGTANDTLSFTPGYAFDTIVVYYNQLPAGGGFGGGTTTVNVNGGSSLGTINTNGSGPTFVAQTVNVGSLVTGTINFTRPTVALTVIVGVWAYNSTRKAVYVHNLGIIGAFTTSFSNAGSWALFPTRKWTLIQLGINDAQGATIVGTWLPIMQGVIAAAQVAGDVTACTVYPSQNGTVQALERQYATALLADAKSNGTYTVDDINGQWGGVYQTAMMFDGLHPNNIGYLYGASSFSNATGFASGSLPTANNGTVPVTTFLSSAQINGMFGSPVSLVPAPGAGKSILVDRIVLHMVTTGTAFAGGGVVSFPYTGGSATTNTIASGVVTAGAGTSDTIVYGKDVTATPNAALTITNATGAYTTGTGWASVTVYYSIVGASAN